MILVRFILIFLIFYLLLRGFIKSLSADNNSSGEKRKNQKFRYTPEKPEKKVSKSIGEYVDYEEVKKKD